MPPTALADSAASPEFVPFTGNRLLTATWGAPSGGYHPYPAIDVALPTGSPVYAAGAGTVVAAHNGCPNNGAACGIENLGNMVRIAHPDGRHSRYGHLTSAAVTSGGVAAGQLIGYSGNSGISDGPHLHYQETSGASFSAAVDPGTWVACHGGSRVDYAGLQSRVNQYVRNDGFSCVSQALADGTFVNDTSDGRVYVIAGGAPLYVSSWAAVGGPKPTLALSHEQLMNLPAYPRDGTLLGASGGGVFIVAGGAPVYLSNWNAIGGPKPVVHVDQWAVDNAGHPASHLRSHPADGTHLTTSAGRLYRVAGGAPIRTSSWSVFGGPQPATLIDQWAVDNASHAVAHMTRVPADGTIVKGLPSGAHWRFVEGRRTSAPAGTAIEVDDVGLEAFPVADDASMTTAPSSGDATPATTPATSTSKHARARLRVLLRFRGRPRGVRLTIRQGRRLVKRTRPTTAAHTILGITTTGRYVLVVTRGGRALRRVPVTLVVGKTRTVLVRL